MRNLSEKLTAVLRGVENPARYTGGEFGLIRKEEAALRCAVCFPDLYEIGMSNQAIAILYGMLNGIENISCERVFCPAEDFENELKKAGILLYGLETGRPLSSFDIVAFTVGYELTAANILTMLDRGGVPLRAGHRSGADPIVIAGGPAITNPLPFAAIFDAVYIGDAEAEFRGIAEDLAAMKKKGASRQDLLERIRDSASFWYAGRANPARRSVWMSFPCSASYAVAGPVPSLRTVQDRGVVEIMRGCPHECRFCHASVYYKPFRMKKREKIYEEVYNLIHKCGYREITLSSLSSGDYAGIARLVNNLNCLHGKERVSFSLPSLHLESLGLQVLSEISAVRRSGLTFAVETPRPEFQMSLNKEASREKILAILREAKQQGWKLAKFYFMTGLPFYEDRGEEAQDIIDFVRSVYAETRISLNINIGTFIPKPHTPYQRAAQLDENQSRESARRIKNGLTSGAIKVGYHAPFQSYLEGVFSRGDERVGELLFEAWGSGARFDAWEDRSHPEAWRRVLESAAWNIETETCRPRGNTEVLPWEKAVLTGTSEAYLRAEQKRHEENTLTAPCDRPCPHPCGVCGAAVFPVTADSGADAESQAAAQEASAPGGFPRSISRHICRYEKTGTAAFLPHLSLMQVMERGLLRAGIALRFTEGFNPKPVLEFAQPSPVGAESLDEVFSFETFNEEASEAASDALNKNLPEGLRITAVSVIRYREKGKKPPSLMSLYTGGRYEIFSDDPELCAKTLSELGRIPAFTIIESSKGRLVVDHACGGNARGFQSLLKAALGDSLKSLRIRKLATRIKTEGI